jgi:hypothetical protein
MLLALLGLTMTPPEAAPNLGSIEGLEPSAIGEVVLRGRDHGTVESVLRDPGLDPPGVVKLKLTERPFAVSGGCLRRKWTATFLHGAGAAERTAILTDTLAATEVSSPTVFDCQKGEFAHVNPGVGTEEALSALRHLRQVRSGKARFSCSDSTDSGLCLTPKTIRRELVRLPAWALAKRNNKIELWLGEGGKLSRPSATLKVRSIRSG